MCFDDYEEPDFITQEIVRAITPHCCCECRNSIEPGTLYEHVSGQWVGHFETFSTCPSCYATRQAVYEAEIREGCPARSAMPPFGGLLECLGQYCPPIERQAAEAGIKLLEERKVKK